MRILRWAFLGVAALMLGFGFAVLSGSFAPAAISAVLVLLVAHLSWERSPSHQPARRRRGASGGTGSAATYGTADGGAAPGGDCGFGGDGGGPFGGDGGGC